MPENSRYHNFGNTMYIILFKDANCQTQNRHSHMLITTGSDFKNSSLNKNNKIDRECQQKIVDIIILGIPCR
jgi:hypothetical protein